MSALHKKILDYRRDGGDPRIAGIMYDLSERNQHLTQTFNDIQRQMVEIATLVQAMSNVLAVQSEAIQVVPQISHAIRRATAMGMAMGNDPHLTGEADES